MKVKRKERSLMNAGFPSLKALAELTDSAVAGDEVAIAALERLPWRVVGFNGWPDYVKALADVKLKRVGAPDVDALTSMLVAAKAGDTEAETKLIDLGLTEWQTLATLV